MGPFSRSLGCSEKGRGHRGKYIPPLTLQVTPSNQLRPYGRWLPVGRFHSYQMGWWLNNILKHLPFSLLLSSVVFAPFKQVHGSMEAGQAHVFLSLRAKG